MCAHIMQVEDDKAQITAVIQQLDEKKRIALEETWKHVSQSSPWLRVSTQKHIRHLLLMVAPPLALNTLACHDSCLGPVQCVVCRQLGQLHALWYRIVFLGLCAGDPRDGFML